MPEYYHTGSLFSIVDSFLYLSHSHFAWSFHPIKKDIRSKGMCLRWPRLGWGRKCSAWWWRWEEPPRPFPHTSWGIWAQWLVLLFSGSLLKTIYVSSNTEKQTESHGPCWNCQLPKRLQCWLLTTGAANSPVTGLPQFTCPPGLVHLPASLRIRLSHK